jgi:N-acetylneuraminic acid mutarotase
MSFQYLVLNCQVVLLKVSTVGFFVLVGAIFKQPKFQEMKNAFTLIGTFLFFASHAQWVKQDDFKGSIRFAATSFVVNEEAFVVGGTIESGPSYITYNETWKYIPTTAAWAKQSAYPGGKMYAGISFVIDNIAYVGLGANQSGVVGNALWAYNSATDSWEEKTNFPGNGRVFAFAFSANGKGYIGTGLTFLGGAATYLDDFWEYDPATDQWTQKTNYPGGGKVGMAAVSINDIGYVGLGDDGGFFYNDFYRYESVTDSWIGLTSFPGENRSFYQMEAAVGDIYLIGGEKAHNVYSAEMWQYSIAKDEWNSSFTFDGTARGYGNLFYLAGSFYYGLGLVGPSDSQGSKEIWKYSLTTGIQQAPNTSSLLAFPNPTSGPIYIQASSSNSEVNVKIYTTQGQKLQSWTLGGGAFAHRIDLDLPKGVYLLTMTTANEQQTIKLVRQQR